MCATVPWISVAPSAIEQGIIARAGGWHVSGQMRYACAVSIFRINSLFFKCENRQTNRSTRKIREREGEIKDLKTKRFTTSIDKNVVHANEKYQTTYESTLWLTQVNQTIPDLSLVNDNRVVGIASQHFFLLLYLTISTISFARCGQSQSLASFLSARSSQQNEILLNFHLHTVRFNTRNISVEHFRSIIPTRYTCAPAHQSTIIIDPTERWFCRNWRTNNATNSNRMRMATFSTARMCCSPFMLQSLEYWYFVRYLLLKVMNFQDVQVKVESSLIMIRMKLATKQPETKWKQNKAARCATFAMCICYSVQCGSVRVSVCLSIAKIDRHSLYNTCNHRSDHDSIAKTKYMLTDYLLLCETAKHAHYDSHDRADWLRLWLALCWLSERRNWVMKTEETKMHKQ